MEVGPRFARRPTLVAATGFAIAAAFGAVPIGLGGGAPGARAADSGGGGRSNALVSLVPAAPADRSLEAAGGKPSNRELVGQRFVVAMKGTRPTQALLDRIGAGEIGGVILFGANVTGRSQLRRLTTTLQGAARNAGRPPLLIATDQEGGSVRRLRWAGPALAADELGAAGPARVEAEAAAAGRQLRAAGVNVDLAPVADIPIPGSFLALEQRTFGVDAPSVAAASSAFVRGLVSARVAATVKHFPGIGRAVRSTDRAAVEIGATAASLSARDLLPFRSAIGARVPLVMVSNASYSAFDGAPATWSPEVESLLRRTLGFEGVTITDSLDVAAATHGRSLPSVSVLAAQAGVDLLLVTGTEAAGAAAFESVVRAAARGRVSPASLGRSSERIAELKRAYG